MSHKNPIIKAECHSDDRRVEITFDALKWFQQASDKEILDLAECGWGGDYPADYVAHFFGSRATHDLFLYLEKFAPNDTGFECHVDEAMARAWIAKRRPHLVDKLCATC
jgi:hypothetical protein